MIVAIHQPNFFPWLGYFRKIARCDIFVFLDAVPFPRTSRGTWINRVKLLVNNAPRWVTCPINRVNGVFNIQDVLIDKTSPWQRRFARTIELSYGKAVYFHEGMKWVGRLVGNSETSLSLYNMASIRAISQRLGLACRFVLQSDLVDPAIFHSKGSQRLAAISRELGASTYLAGDGAEGYEDESAYESAGIKLAFNRFKPFVYPQIGTDEFIPGLSILDALFNIGAAETARLLLHNE